MPKFVLNKPVVTEEPVVRVEAGIEPGERVFTLVVVDDDGNESQPAEAVVIVG